jgi:hypothetical protein
MSLKVNIIANLAGQAWYVQDVGPPLAAARAAHTFTAKRDGK